MTTNLLLSFAETKNIIQSDKIEQKINNNDHNISLETYINKGPIEVKTDNKELKFGEWDYLALASIDGILIALIPFTFVSYAFKIIEVLSIVGFSIIFLLVRKIFIYPLTFTSYWQIAKILVLSSIVVYLLIIFTLFLLSFIPNYHVFGRSALHAMCPLKRFKVKLLEFSQEDIKNYQK